jgi:hypothetical protein
MTEEAELEDLRAKRRPNDGENSSDDMAGGLGVGSDASASGKVVTRQSAMSLTWYRGSSSYTPRQSNIC